MTQALALGGSSQSADAARQTDGDEAEEAEGQDEDQPREEEHEPGRLELESPADLLSPRLQGGHQGRQDQEGQHHPGREGQAELTDTAGFLSSLGDEGEGLQGDDRQHARHQVQDQPPDDRHQQVPPQGRGAAGGGAELRGEEVDAALAQVEADGAEPPLSPRPGEGADPVHLARQRLSRVGLDPQLRAGPLRLLLHEGADIQARPVAAGEGEKPGRLAPLVVGGHFHRHSQGAAAVGFHRRPPAHGIRLGQGRRHHGPVAVEEVRVGGLRLPGFEVQRQGRPSGDADLPADQPVHLGREPQGVGQDRRRLHGGQQHHLVGVPEDGQVLLLVAVGSRPLQGGRIEARRGLPFDLGGLARVPGPGPVGVPSGILLQEHSKGEVAPHLDGGHVGQQPGAHGIGELGLARGGPERRQECETQGQHRTARRLRSHAGSSSRSILAPSPMRSE